MTESEDDTFDLPEDYNPDDRQRSRAGLGSAVTVAMMSAEADVDVPGLRQAASMVSNLIALPVGGCFTKSQLVDDTVTMLGLQDNLTEWKYKLRQSVNQAVRRARAFDKRELSIETSQAITPTGRVYVQVIVTRDK